MKRLLVLAYQLTQMIFSMDYYCKKYNAYLWPKKESFSKLTPIVNHQRGIKLQHDGDHDLYIDGSYSKATLIMTFTRSDPTPKWW